MASPIEDILFNALCGAAESWCPTDTEATLLRLAEGRRAFVFRDVPVLTYRADLAISGYAPGHRLSDRTPVLMIECDGHDFHDRTKQQAAYDRARDRELLLHRGFVTIRFTGSEIFHSPERCAREALDILRALIDRTAPALDITGAVGG